MKYKLLCGGLIAAFMLSAGPAFAADRPSLNERQRQAVQPQLQVPQGSLKPVATNPCPQGWSLTGPVQSNGSYMCKPTKPRPGTCPPHTQWVDNGCSVGCQTILY